MSARSMNDNDLAQNFTHSYSSPRWRDSKAVPAAEWDPVWAQNSGKTSDSAGFTSALGGEVEGRREESRSDRFGCGTP